MEIVEARWTPRVNLLRVRCGCGKEHEHRADRWTVRCPHCGALDHLGSLRAAYVEKGR